ncbi:hypothetical protein [Enterobacter roggenkampii]|uniref:phage tail fiber protein n=1 Tax=Enterobacter roggenkampii TaxID=1812935 RepID=UPI003D7D1D45
MQVGAFGLGSSTAQVITDVWDKSLGSRFIMMSPATSGGPKFYSMGIRISERNWGNGPNDVSQQSFSAFSMGGKRFTWMTMADGVNSGWLEVYHSGNTTTSSDGTLRIASPVVRIFSDGAYQNNDESEGCAVTRLGVGEYLIEGCTGLNADAAWGGIDGGFDIPTDRNKQPLIWLDYKVNSDGSVLVKTYHRTHPNAPAFSRNELLGVNDGDPVDIPRDQFVSIRVEMPADSIWNQRQKDTTRAPVKE